MEMNLIKLWKETRRKRMEKLYAQAEQEIRDEAAEKITVREMFRKDTNEMERVICFDGSVIYIAESGEDLTDRLFQLRNLYFEMWSHKPVIELR